MIATQQSTSARPDVEAVKEEWTRGGEPDARQALDRRPEWRAEKSIVLDLAYEEYCRRYDAGERLHADDFCERFPTYRLALRPLIEAHRFLADNIELLADAPPPRWPEPGERLGDLRLIRELGRGAFARVYLATEESTGGRPVAVKLSPEGADEARTMGRLVHPGVVPVLSARFEEQVGLTVVRMPFLGAATLTDLLDRAYPTADSAPPRRAAVVAEAIRAASRPADPAPLSSGPGGCPERGAYMDAVARLGLQMAEALAFLHSQGVIHRDLKPSNVLLGPDGRALLLDFNLSADARAGGPLVGGTLPYMAPEQLHAWLRRAEGGPTDGRVDLFALGVILYELLTGKNPFGSPPADQSPTGSAALRLERQRQGFTSLRSLNPAVDRRLARLVEECLAFDPDRRPASTAVVAARLRAYLSRPARLRRWAARRPWAVLPAAALLLGAGVMAAAAARQPAPAAPTAVAVADPEPADVQAYRRGRDAYRKGDYAAAREAFSQAFEHSPSDAKYLRARAEAELRLAEAGDKDALLDARDRFIALSCRQADGATMALVGYCFARGQNHAEAVVWYNKAEHAGFASAGLFNDRAYSGITQMQWDTARGDLYTALQMDPNLTAALYNRAMLAILTRPQVNPPAVPEDVLQGMRAAAVNAPPSRQLYLDAAYLFAMAAQGDQPSKSEKAEEALAYLRKACDRGADPKDIAADPIFGTVLGSLPAFHDLKKGPDQPSAADVNLKLIDPAPYQPD